MTQTPHAADAQNQPKPANLPPIHKDCHYRTGRVAQYLGVCRGTVVKLINQGRLPAYTFGDRDARWRYVKGSDLLKYIADMKRYAPPKPPPPTGKVSP